MRPFILAIVLFISCTSLGHQTRLELVNELAKQANYILPWNWFLVQTDSSLTAYFCRTSLNKEVGSTGVFIENQDDYGDQFWGAPIPDSICVLSIARAVYMNKAPKAKRAKKGSRNRRNKFITH